MTKRSVVLLSSLLIATPAFATEHLLDPGEIEKLTPHPTVDGVSRYVSPGVDMSNYENIIIGGVTFYFDEKSKTKDIDADEMKQISDTLKASLVSAAAGKGNVVLTPGPKTVLLNIAVTEINMQNKKRGLLGYPPIGLVTTTAMNLSGIRIKLREASMEGEAVDSETGNVLSVFRIEEIGNWDDKKGMSWEDLRVELEVTMAHAIAAARGIQ